MERRVAIVTAGLRGLGRAMVFGRAREGRKVVAVGHDGVTGVFALPVDERQASPCW